MVERATKNYDETVKKYGVTSLEAREAEYNLDMARQELKTSTDAVGVATDEVKNKEEEKIKMDEKVREAEKKTQAVLDDTRSRWERIRDAISGALSKFWEWATKPSDLMSDQGFEFRAVGGPVSSGSPYMVGERGPEMFVPNVSGKIIPNNQGSGTGGSAPVFNVNVGIYAGTEMEKRSLAKTLFDSYSSYLRMEGKQLSYEPA